MAYLFYLRIKQLLRIFSEVGVFRSVILLVLLVFTIVNLLRSVETKSILTMVFYVPTLFFLHTFRIDKKTLQSIFDRPFVVYVIEYLILSLPLISAFVMFGKWIEATATIAVIITIGFSNAATEIRFKLFIKRSNLLIKLPFEWIGGLRRNWLVLSILYLTGILFSNYPSAIPAIIIFSTGVITSFNNECEPHQILTVFELAPKSLLLRKFNEQIKSFILLYGPLGVLYIVFFPTFWYVSPLILFVCCVLVTLSICLKYASYIPNENMGLNSIIIGLSIVCLMIPFLAPLPFLLIIKKYKTAIKNLEEYLYAYHS